LKPYTIVSEPRIVAEKLAILELKGERIDQFSQAPNTTTKVEGTNYVIYPWGKNNFLPNEMLSVAQSNGDVLNLLATKKDFYFGAGIGVFTWDELTQKPKDRTHELNIQIAILAGGLNQFARKTSSSYIDTAFAPFNVSIDNQNMTLSALDPLVVRAAKVEESKSKISHYLVSSNWKEKKAKKTAIPAFDPLNPQKESIAVIKAEQTGQFFYGYPDWWSVSGWIKLANKINEYYNNSIASEGNLGHIIRVSDKVVDIVQNDMGLNPSTNEPYLQEDARAAIEIDMDLFLSNTDSTIKKKLLDWCGQKPDGTLAHGIEIEVIPKSFQQKDFQETYALTLNAIAGAMQVMGGLSGVSDGKLNSGGGTEITAGSNYQQFFRTARDREPLLDFLNLHYMPTFKRLANLPETENIYFGFRNILLETLDKNKNGNSTQLGNG
jgi:hypothetical protein